MMFIIPGLILMALFDSSAKEQFLKGNRTATCKMCKLTLHVDELPKGGKPAPANSQFIYARRRQMQEEERRRQERWEEDN